MQIIIFLTAVLLGFFIFESLTNPSKKVYHKLPNLKLKWVELFPNIRIHIRGKVIHLHHWMSLSFILMITVIYSAGFLDTIFARGALVGGIAQGLTFPDWKKIIQKNN